MLRKHPFNQHRNTSLYSEIKKEFGLYFNRAESALIAYINRHPQTVFKVMLVAMALSFVVSFTVLRNVEKQKHSSAHPAEILSEKKTEQGLSQIIATGAALRQTISIKNEIDHILAKKQLSAQDSIRLGKALDSLEYLRKNLK